MLDRARISPPVAPVRVMHVLYRLHPGGMEFGVIKLTNGLEGSAVESSICSTRPATDMKALLRRSVKLFELQRRDGNDPFLVWHLYRLFRRERPHIVHTHAWGTLCEGLIAARLAGVPAVVHGEHGTLQTRPYQRRVQHWAWSAVDRVLAVSSRLAERMAEQVRFPLSRITTIRNGVDLDRFDPSRRADARARLGLDPGDLAIGTVGRLVDVKDHRTLIRALARLRDRGVRFHGIIAGDGPLRAALEREIAALSLEGLVRLAGHLPDIERVLPALDIFVLSSKSEGLSNTIQEAMASGVPVVATRVGGADELVDHGRTGLLVDAGDPDALASAIESLALDPERRGAMGLAGRHKAAAEFSLTRMLQDYESVYVDVVARRSARGAAHAAQRGAPG